MFNRRVSKTHPRVEACGALDELNSALGLARAQQSEASVQGKLLKIQHDLIRIMGEIATLPEDRERYHNAGYGHITAQDSAQLETWIQNLESERISFKGWATPGATYPAAALDFARSVARRAERRVQDLIEKGELPSQLIQVYLNRVSDLLWLLARWHETETKAVPDS